MDSGSINDAMLEFTGIVNGLLPMAMPPSDPMTAPGPGIASMTDQPPDVQAHSAALMQHYLQQIQMQQQQVHHAGVGELSTQQTHAVQAFEQASNLYEQQKSFQVAPEVTELAEHFNLDERITKDLDVEMKKRKSTYDDDMKALWDILEGARNPAGLLRVKIREMEEHTFRGGALTPDREIEEMAAKYKLDAQATAKLSEVLAKREDRNRDLRQLSKHLELSNKPSALAMLMLRDLRAGKSILDPEFPAAVGSYAHKRGLRGCLRNRSRSRGKRRKQRRRSESSSPPSSGRIRRAGSGPSSSSASKASGARPMTLLERFG